MMTSPCRAPKDPLIAIFGSTGTGKSELAVEIATRFRGEIINADAMQLYCGLPVITNKISTADQRGIPHHLLDRIPLDQVAWDVTKFRKMAQQTILEIRSRGNLPIIVGGSHYYIGPLLFTDAILDDVQEDRTKLLPILDASTEEMHAELRRIDPEMAEKWHPKDRRKIRRSLEIFLHSGKKPSELYAAQQKRNAAMAAKDADADAAPWDKLLFWLHAKNEVLNPRLDKRVEHMFANGLVDEVQALFQAKLDAEKDWDLIDTTKGIWQAIGYKQLEPYMGAVFRGDEQPSTLEKFKVLGIENIKTATRRYARLQEKWIIKKLVPRLKNDGQAALDSLYVLDSSHLARYQMSVVTPAVTLVSQFLQGQSRQLPRKLSNCAGSVLSLAMAPQEQPVYKQRMCNLCHMILVTDDLWKRHIESSNHRRMLSRAKRFALVSSLQQPGSEEAGPVAEFEEIIDEDEDMDEIEAEAATEDEDNLGFDLLLKEAQNTDETDETDE